MGDKALVLWVSCLFLLFLWFGAWGGIIQPLLPGNVFDSMAALKLIAGLLALGIGILMDQLEVIKELLRLKGKNQ